MTPLSVSHLSLNALLENVFYNCTAPVVLIVAWVSHIKSKFKLVLRRVTDWNIFSTTTTNTMKLAEIAPNTKLQEGRKQSPVESQKPNRLVAVCLVRYLHAVSRAANSMSVCG